MKNEKHTKVCFLFKESLDVVRLITVVDNFMLSCYNVITVKERDTFLKERTM